MVLGTLHPLGQIGPCPCGTGLRFIDCHTPMMADLPCTCGSGERMADCCVLDHHNTPEEVRDRPKTYDLVPKPASVATAKAGRNDRCPSGSGTKLKKCCGVVVAVE